MKRLIPAILLIASAGAYAQMPSADDIMKENDKNKDGVIAKEEVKGSMLEMVFDFMDGNHDGKLTMDELKAMSAGGPPGGAGGPPPGGAGGPPPGT